MYHPKSVPKANETACISTRGIIVNLSEIHDIFPGPVGARAGAGRAADRAATCLLSSVRRRGSTGPTSPGPSGRSGSAGSAGTSGIGHTDDRDFSAVVHVIHVIRGSMTLNICFIIHIFDISY